MMHFSVPPMVWLKPDGTHGVIPPNDYVYDEESFPNCFTCTILHPVTGSVWVFEVSDRCNDSAAFMHFIFAMQRAGCRLVGFNNYFYDYPVMHHLIAVWRQCGTFTAWHAYEKTDLIINKTPFNDKYRHVVWDDQTVVIQVDLLMIHHFDNPSKRTDLKTLEFNMRADNVGDLPFEPGTWLTFEQIDILLRYNIHDVKETARFYIHSLDAITFRDELFRTTGLPCINYNDTKIGKEFFRLELEKALNRSIGKRDRTERPFLPLAESILPHVRFESDEFTRGLEFLKKTTITQTNKPPELKGFSVTYGNFAFDIGVGGIHGSVKRMRAIPKDDEDLVDIDVASFYPNLSISNETYPEHLSKVFCTIYKSLYDKRKSVPKANPVNGMLKLALNGVTGDSNQGHSKGFFDPKYFTMITLNGQLLLCMLAERLIKYAGAQIVQINTDGLTAIVKKAYRPLFKELCDAWEAEMRLELEHVEYSQMIIRDVNNYMAVGKDGKVKKRKGAYQWKTDKPSNLSESLVWHQDWSSLVIPMAVEQQLLHGVPVRDFIHSYDDAFDFMLKAKAPGKGHLELDDGRRLQKVTRYHIARHGAGMRAVHPPLAKNPDKIRNISIQAGYSVQVCDHVRDFDPANLNHDWYVKEAEKLII